MTVEELNKLKELEKKINRYKRLINLLDNNKVRIAFFNAADNLYFNEDSDFVRKEDLNNMIYSCVRDTLDDLMEKFKDIVICIKDKTDIPIYIPFKI